MNTDMTMYCGNCGLEEEYWDPDEPCERCGIYHWVSHEHMIDRD